MWPWVFWCWWCSEKSQTTGGLFFLGCRDKLERIGFWFGGFFAEAHRQGYPTKFIGSLSHFYRRLYIPSGFLDFFPSTVWFGFLSPYYTLPSKTAAKFLVGWEGYAFAFRFFGWTKNCLKGRSEKTPLWTDRKGIAFIHGYQLVKFSSSSR